MGDGFKMGDEMTVSKDDSDYTIENLEADTLYIVRVDSLDAGGKNIPKTNVVARARTLMMQAPSITDITDRNATFGTNLMVDVDATPVDNGDMLEYKAESSDEAVATVSPTTLTAHNASSQVTVTPVGAGTATITVTVSDGTAMSTDTFMVTVSKAKLGKPVVTLTVQDGALTPHWAAVPNAVSYDMQWRPVPPPPPPPTPQEPPPLWDSAEVVSGTKIGDLNQRPRVRGARAGLSDLPLSDLPLPDA